MTRARSVAGLLLVSTVGLLAFGWPLIADPGSATVAHSSDAPWLFALLAPLVLLVVMVELAGGGADSKSVAMLGLLAATAAALRPLGGGVIGFEPIFVVLLIGGRVLGPGLGFALGSMSLFVSALITGGVGPWLPFQMLGAAWFACGAGMLPRSLRGRTEVVMLACYGFVGAIAYGFLLNLWFWPWIGTAADSSGAVAGGFNAAMAYVPGADVGTNLLHWWRFCLATSLGFDLPRGIVTVVLTFVLGRPALLALRRATRRAAFGARPEFSATKEPAHA